MQQGCQDYFKHRAKKNIRIIDERCSLSFRRIIPSNEEQHPPMIFSPVKTAVANFENLNTTSDNTQQVTYSPLEHKSTLPTPVSKSSTKTAVIFGTSMTIKVDADRLGKSGRNVVNCSKSGAKINDIHEMVENFYLNSNLVDVDKIIFSFGTNDIRFQTRNMYHKFYDQIIELVERTKCLFPRAIIFIQTVLPMRITNRYTVQNILEFNRLLTDVCIKMACSLLDCFRDFVSRDGYDYDRMLFKDDIHLNYRGVGILCRWFKHVIYRDVFNPFIL